MQYKLIIEENVTKTYEILVDTEKKCEEIDKICDSIEEKKKLSDAIAILDVAGIKIREINQEDIYHISINIPEIIEVEGENNNEFC